MKTRASMSSFNTYGKDLTRYQKIMAITPIAYRKSTLTLSQLGLLMEGFKSTI